MLFPIAVLLGVDFANSKITSIGVRAFEGCNQLEYINFDVSNLEACGRLAFYGCSSLKELNFGDSKLENIEQMTFGYCEELELILPNTISSVYKDTGSITRQVFYNVPVVNFPNGINESLKIPVDLWGANEIIVNGEAAEIATINFTLSGTAYEAYEGESWLVWYERNAEQDSVKNNLKLLYESSASAISGLIQHNGDPYVIMYNSKGEKVKWSDLIAEDAYDIY